MTSPSEEKEQDTASYQVVARRYRPQDFQTLIGQEAVSKILTGAIESGRIGHAYLFTGARGVGKTTTARIFAKALDCEHGPTITPCNECEICRAISTGDDLDVLEIDGASNRGVEEIRQIRTGATVRPSRARFRIYIIDEVHMLTKEAFNALLKILEEPPAHVKFIFCTTEPNKLPITILSRCQRFDFAGIRPEEILSHLNNVSAQEGIVLQEGVAEMLSRQAAGSMRDALSLLEQLLSFGKEEVTLDDVYRMLGTVDDRIIFNLLHAIQDEAVPDIFSILAEASDHGGDFAILIEQLMGFFRDMLALTAESAGKNLLYTSPARVPELKQIALSMGIDRILASMQILDQTISRMRYSTQGRILLELSLVRLTRLSHLELIASLIERIKKGSLGNESILSVPSPSPRLTVEETRNVVDQKKMDEPVESTKISSFQKDLSYRSAQPQPTEKETLEKKIPVDIKQMTTKEIASLWQKVTKKLGVALAAHARMAKEILAEGKDSLCIIFSESQSAAMRYCRDNSSRISHSITDIIGTPCTLKWELVQDAESVSEIEEKETSEAETNDRELFRQTNIHPMVREAEKLFQAELTKVKIEPLKHTL